MSKPPEVLPWSELKRRPIVRYGGGFLVLLFAVGGVLGSYAAWKSYARAAAEAEVQVEIEQGRAVTEYLAAHPPALPPCDSKEIRHAAQSVANETFSKLAVLNEVSTIEAESIPLRMACRSQVRIGSKRQWMRFTVERAGSQWFIQFSEL